MNIPGSFRAIAIARLFVSVPSGYNAQKLPEDHFSQSLRIFMRRIPLLSSLPSLQELGSAPLHTVDQ